MSKITVVDAVMGAGKSSFAIQMMSDPDPEKRFMYITPFLDEGERIKDNVKNRTMLAPDNEYGTKANSLYRLIKSQYNIASTHSLFLEMGNGTMELIRDKHYVLVLDEVLDVIEPYVPEKGMKMKKDTLRILQDANCISIAENGFVRWNPEKDDYDSDFNKIKWLAERDRLICVDNVLLVQKLPPEVFQIFDEIYILTYLFEGSLLYYYFQFHGIEYEKKSLLHNGNIYELTEFFEADTSLFKELIEIYEGNEDSIFYRNACSWNWYSKKNNAKYLDVLRRNLNNYFRNKKRAKTNDIMWTTFKEYATKIHSAGFKYKDIEPSKIKEEIKKVSFVPCNCRATNMYSHKSVLGYCVNRYMHPEIKKFFQQQGIEVDEDTYALSEMIQWIWRSRIRNGEPISIYVSSGRMLFMLKKWLRVALSKTENTKKMNKTN